MKPPANALAYVPEVERASRARACIPPQPAFREAPRHGPKGAAASRRRIPLHRRWPLHALPLRAARCRLKRHDDARST